MKWSFKADSGACERNYVCNDHTNSFESKEECDDVCPSTPGTEPGVPSRDCYYWFIHGSYCGRSRTFSYWRGGDSCTVIYYTGCFDSSSNVYAYDSCYRKCIQVQ
ncbi:uncharacterized protein LOC144140854 [Haemaphysalis longicornis]